MEEKVERLLKDHKRAEREIESLKAKLLSKASGDLLSGIQEIKGIHVLVREVDADSPKALREYADRIKDQLISGIAVLGSKKEGKVMLICVVSNDLQDRFKAGDIVRQLSQEVGGKGGGRADMAQGGGNKPHMLGQALDSVYDLVGR
jgi:alanyl-tRNA synthetase